MTQLTQRDVEYAHDGTIMKGVLCAPSAAAGAPGVLLVHDAFGLTDETLDVARGLTELGFAVFAADVWGDRTQPQHESDIGPLIGSMVSDRSRWMARMQAAHATAVEQPEIDGASLVAMGYCFGASSALELLRSGADLRGVISVHGGLDLLEVDADWSAAETSARVLICSGAEDPMATPEQCRALQSALSQADIEWEFDLYSNTKHAFTSRRAKNSPHPEVIAYNERSATRAWDATTRLLTELNPQLRQAQS